MDRFLTYLNLIERRNEQKYVGYVMDNIFNELNRENIERLHERYNRLNRFVIADF